MEVLITAFLLDIVFADPFWLYHPVQAMGLFSVFIEKILRRIKFCSLYILGIVHWIINLLFFTAIFFTISHFLQKIGAVYVKIFYIYLTYSFLAIGSLTREARVIYKLLKSKDIDSARKRVQGIVSRDMSDSNEAQITRAVIETVTENISDGIIAPLFFYALGGPFLMLVYKLSNTLDSMIGYKNEKYIKYGWFSARMDDLLNIIPARLTGILIILTSYIHRDSAKTGLQAWNRDAQKGPSPNGGIPIVTYAGARNIKLGGPCKIKSGEIINIPYVGGENNFSKEEIKTVIFYAYSSSFLMIIIVGLYILNI